MLFVLASKSRVVRRGTVGTSHKKARRMTPPGRKRAVSGWILSNIKVGLIRLFIGGEKVALTQ